MGVIYKLKAEIINFILAQKKAQPILSCRALKALVEQKFQIKVSKSSINFILKEAGLSLPVGRRQKKKRRLPQIPPVAAPEEIKLLQPPSETKVREQVQPVALAPSVPQAKPVEAKVEMAEEVPSQIRCTGAILLKAADYLIGGSAYIAEVVKSRLNRQDQDFLAKTESLIYLPLFQEAQTQDLSPLWALTGKKLSLEAILSYLNELQAVRTIRLDISRIISSLLEEVRCLKVNFADGNSLYLDGQMYTAWSTPHIPYGFSSTICNVKSYINKYFQKAEPFILFMAPGYTAPTVEFFNFILSLETQENKIKRLILYGNRFEELESIPVEQTRKQFFVFGLWPGHFVEYRKVKKIGDFKPGYFAALKKNFLLAEIEIELSQPLTNKSVTLRGCALKTSLAEKPRWLVLSNLAGTTSPEELLNLYLGHWPNLEEAFQDFSRKIELFTYTANSQRFFSTENLDLIQDTTAEIKTFFNQYLAVLDLYVRWHFLPPGYEDKDFSTMKEQFYDLSVTLNQEKERILAVFSPPQGLFPFRKDLEYACRRLNEREIIFTDGRRLWCCI